MSFTAGQMLDIIEAAGYPTMWVSIPLEYDVTTWSAMLDSGERVNFFETMVSAPQIAVKALMVANVPATPSFTIAQRFDCRLVAGSSPFDVLYLQRCNGTQLFINSYNYPIIAGGVSKSSTGLSVSTLYYVYAYWTGTIIALEFSTTSYVQDAEHDHLIKTGDGSRTYVGMVYMPAAGIAFKDNDQERFVASYYNRINKPVEKQMEANRGGVWTFPVEMSTSDRAEFICHGDEAYSFSFGATGECPTIGNRIINAIGLDGTGTLIGTAMAATPVASIAQRVSGVQGYKPSPGYHYITGVGGSNSANQIDYYATYCRIGAMLRQ